MADTDNTPDRAKLCRRANWKWLGGRVAKKVYRKHCDPHRLADTFGVEGHSFAYLANNHPYADRPHRRAAEHAAFRDWAFAAGVRVLAEESYPKSGADAGHTCVLVLDLDPNDDEQAETFALCVKYYRKVIDSPAAAAHEKRLASGTSNQGPA